MNEWNYWARMPCGFYRLHYRLAIITDFHSGISMWLCSVWFWESTALSEKWIRSVWEHCFRVDSVAAVLISLIVVHYFSSNIYLCLALTILCIISFVQSHTRTYILPIYLFIISFRVVAVTGIFDLKCSKRENKTNLILMKKTSTQQKGVFCFLSAQICEVKEKQDRRSS